MERILGIDPGLASLGFGIVEFEEGQPDEMELVDFGIIQTKARSPLGDRLSTIYDDLHDLIELYQPTVVGIEKLFFYRMGNTILVAQARGVILLVLGQEKLDYMEFTPAQIKQALTGYGNADKLMVQEAVMRELELDSIPRPDDAADALAVAIATSFQRL